VIFGRTRPKLLYSAHLYAFTWISFSPDHWSFPSGHAVTATAVAASLFLLWPRHVLVYVLFAAIVAASRLIVGEHYLSDVVAGAFIGLASTRGVARLFARGGIDLESARVGVAPKTPPWPCRYLSPRRGPTAGIEDR
jgi:membrane-associated phospholipid phosphatase